MKIFTYRMTQRHPTAFPAINKMSDKILALLHNKENKAFILQNNLFTQEVMEELFSDTYYRTLGKALDHCPTQESMFEAIVTQLSIRPVTDLPVIMHLHQLFYQKFYDHLPAKTNVVSTRCHGFGKAATLKQT